MNEQLRERESAIAVLNREILLLQEKVTHIVNRSTTSSVESVVLIRCLLPDLVD